MTGTPEEPLEAAQEHRTLNRRQLLLGGAAAVGGAAFLAACGDDDNDSADTEAPADTDAAGDSEASGGATDAAALGTTTLGSNFSDEVPKSALAAALATTGVDVEGNTIDHNTYQENFNTYIQQPDDVVSWFAAARMRAFAARGVLGDISDVWSESLDDLMSDGG